MSRETLLVETTLEESFINEYYGCYWTAISPTPFTLTVGETYAVVWDGSTFECVAQDGSAIVDGAVFIGNATAFGLDGNNEPFIIGGTLDDGEMCNFLCLTDTEPTIHTVSIYREVADEAHVVLKDRNGNGVEYPGVEQIQVMTADGGTKNFVPFDSVPVSVEKTIDPDFSAGDMVVTPEDGQVFSGVTVTKPENLVPGNIPVGINIAGIDGAREEASGGDENATFLYAYSSYQRATGVTSKEFSVKVTLPAGAVVKIAKIRRSFTNMYAGTIPSGLSFTSSNCVEPTFEDVDGKIRISHSAVVTTTSTSYVINLIYLLFVSFELYGYKIRRNSDECTVYLTEDADISAFSMYYAFQDNVTVLDFSACKQAFAITSSQFGYIEYVKKIILPSSVTSIESSAFVGCSSLICIDMSNATAVPTLANSYAIPKNAGLEIRVPSALYSQWITATNWSALADYIVAV